MHLNDEKRPQINGFPAYFCVPDLRKSRQELKPYAIIHYPRITSVSHHVYRLSFTLKCQEEEFTYFEKSTLVSKPMLGSVLAAFEEDPEDFIREVFNYVFSKEGRLIVKSSQFGPQKKMSSKELSKLNLEDI